MVIISSIITFIWITKCDVDYSVVLDLLDDGESCLGKNKEKCIFFHRDSTKAV